MAIMVRCKCGKQYKAKDQHVGRRFPCTSCGATLQVPAPSSPPPTAPAPPPAAKKP